MAACNGRKRNGRLADPGQHSRDVVVRAAVECREQQVVHAFLGGKFAARDDAGERIVAERFGKAVAAQEEGHARFQPSARHAYVQLLWRGDAQRLGQHVALWMPRGKGGIELAGSDKFLHQRMVVADLPQAVLPQVYTAVADPGDLVAFAIQVQGGNRPDAMNFRADSARLVYAALAGSATKSSQP